MQLHNTIYKALPILNYAALYELWGSITFYKAPWNLSATIEIYGASLTEASSLMPDSSRRSPWNETVKLSRRQITVANSPVQWPPWTWCRTWWHHSWHSHLKSAYFAFIRPRTPLVYRYHVISWNQSHSTVFGCSPSRSTERHPTRRLTVDQLLYSSDCVGTGRATQIIVKQISYSGI